MCEMSFPLFALNTKWFKRFAVNVSSFRAAMGPCMNCILALWTYVVVFGRPRWIFFGMTTSFCFRLIRIFPMLILWKWLPLWTEEHKKNTQHIEIHRYTATSHSYSMHAQTQAWNIRRCINIWRVTNLLSLPRLHLELLSQWRLVQLWPLAFAP